jgi:hypothetical protein
MIRTLFVSLMVAICKAVRPHSLIDDIPPCPLILGRSTAFSGDSCRRLCDEFSADRRGNGFALCDTTAQSTCTRSLSDSNAKCAFLYWSITEDGQPGIVYSLDGTDLSDAERGHPISCDEADQIVWPTDSAIY